MNVKEYTATVVKHMIDGLNSKDFRYKDVPETIVDGSGSYLLNKDVLVALKNSINTLMMKKDIDDLVVSFDSFTWVSTKTNGNDLSKVIVTDTSDDLLRSPDDDDSDVVLNILSCYVTWLVVYCLSKSDNIKWIVELSIKALYVKTILHNIHNVSEDVSETDRQLVRRVERWIDYLDHLLVKHGYSAGNLLLFCSSIFKLSSGNYANRSTDRDLGKEILRGVFGTPQSIALFNYTYKLDDTKTNRRVSDFNRISDHNVDNLVTAFLAEPYFPETRDEKNIVGIGFLDIAIRNIILGGEELSEGYEIDYSKIKKSILAADSEVSRVWDRYTRTIKDPAILNRHLTYIRKLYYDVNVTLGSADSLPDPYLTFLCVYGFVENLISIYKLEKITKLSTRLNKSIIREAVVCVRDNYDTHENVRLGISNIIGKYIENVYPHYGCLKQDIHRTIEYILKSRLYTGSVIRPNHVSNTNIASETTDLNRVIVILHLMELYKFPSNVLEVLNLEQCIPGYEDCKIDRLTLKECAVEIFNMVNNIDDSSYAYIPSVDTAIMFLLALNSDRALLNTQFFRPVIDNLISPEEETKPDYLDYLAKYVDIFYQVVAEDCRLDTKTFVAKVPWVRHICNRINVDGKVCITLGNL